MGRPKTDVRISLKGEDGRTVRVGLVSGPDERWLVYRDGNVSKRNPVLSSTLIGKMIAKWLMGQRKRSE